MNKSNINIREIATEIIQNESAVVSNLLSYTDDSFTKFPVATDKIVQNTIINIPTLKASNLTEQNKITSVVVLQDSVYTGFVHIHDIIREEIV